MTDVAIRVDDLWKQYKIGLAKVRHDTFRDQLFYSATAVINRWGGRLRRTIGRHSESSRAMTSSRATAESYIWALREVSLEVKEGQVVGIIGRNGAGKSTLLKILSRITEPTKGSVEIHGRVGSLLEVGTGFHPELTGRENIYLNAAILGMRKVEIHRQFDEIVAFSEIDKFIDTPVKRYSSGMYVRLAFAVAAHLVPEILIVDEVLAVGDVAFQKKCLGRMHEVTQMGRTVLFVSHNMAAIKSLCNRVVLMEGGRLAYEGSVDEAVETYLKTSRESSSDGLISDDTPRLWSTSEAKFLAARVSTSSAGAVQQLYFGQPFSLILTLDVFNDIREAVIEVGIATLEGIRVTYSSNIDGDNPPMHLRRGRYNITVDIETVLLPRRYTLDLGIHHRNGVTVDWVEGTGEFEVMNVAETGGDYYPWYPAVRGFIRPLTRWRISEAMESLPTEERPTGMK